MGLLTANDPHAAEVTDAELDRRYSDQRARIAGQWDDAGDKARTAVYEQITQGRYLDELDTLIHLAIASASGGTVVDQCELGRRLYAMAHGAVCTVCEAHAEGVQS